MQLGNGATLTGIAHVPSAQDSTEAPGKPLLVGIHGATCSAYLWDVSPSHTVSSYSDLTGVPFVAFHRPNFLGSSGWLVDHASDVPTEPQFQVAEGPTFFQEEARWYHELIFPALWNEFAVPNGCTSLVTTSHSMCVPPTIIASGLYSKQDSGPTAGYIWAGMILSGFAEIRTQHSNDRTGELATNKYDPSQLPFSQNARIHFPPYYQKDKEELMLGPPGLCDPELPPLIWKQNTPIFMQEFMDMVGMWPNAKQTYKAAVRMPILYGLGEYDWIWQGTKENVDLFCNEFTASPRVEGALVHGAPHAIELSRVRRGWWTRVFGWAIEVAASQVVQDAKSKPMD